MAKFAIGEEVELYFTVDKKKIRYTGTVVSYDLQDVVVKIDGTDSRKPALQFFPASILQRYYAFPHGRQYAIARNQRYVQPLVYEDGIDNWI